MVLLTPSTISVAVSSAVVSLFTFLLFLSGYTLQQQTVRSLQQALRQPPPPRPIPTLPPQFLPSIPGGQAPEISEAPKKDITSGTDFADTLGIHGGQQNTFRTAGQQAIIISSDPQRNAPSEAHVDTEIPALGSLEDASVSIFSSSAYLLPLITPSSVCAALLFAKQKQSRPQYNEPPVVLLYPSTWESHPDEDTLAALNLLRSAIDSHSSTYGQIILHPVQVSSVWSGAGMIEGQLISEISRSRWDFDRLLYLRLPGHGHSSPLSTQRTHQLRCASQLGTPQLRNCILLFSHQITHHPPLDVRTGHTDTKRRSAKTSLGTLDLTLESPCERNGD